MYSYHAYGLHVQSELLLPELAPGRDSRDVLIRFGPIESPYESPTESIQPRDSRTDTIRRVHQTQEGILISWNHIGKFLVNSGREIVIDPVNNADQSLIRQIILGPLLGILLNQRGLAVFHAGAISFPKGAALFMARKGFGKSTLTAALHTRGHPLITDDVAALRFDDANAWVIPGIPQIKLWPDAIIAMDGDPSRFSKVKADLDKRVVPITERLASAECVIKSIYILELGNSIEILRLGSKEALISVASEWYGTLFQGQLLKILGYERQFRESVSLLEKTLVYQLTRPLAYNLIDDVCLAVECHLSTFETSV